MVDGRSQLSRAVVVDLDGTLLRQNSFRLYVRAGIKTRHAPFVLLNTIVRKMGLTDHNSYRERCMRLIGFGADVLGYMKRKAVFSKTVVEFIEARRREGYRIVLATAALEGYVGYLWDGEYTATRHTPTKILRDSRGHAKLHDVRKLLGGSLPEYIISDSPADYPLMRAVSAAGGTAILANPTLSAASFYTKNLPGVKILKETT
ncbi:MAG: haloacid dehalogenase-like hydrolase [Muribaculaceae bacterium]|nr:haloacid dehalogenase-like hydrolase [Muribaculaceae bacterium]